MTVNAGVIGALHPGLDDNQLADMARDTAIDFYLEFLTHNDAWGKAGLVFKGGTAVRKFHCPPRDYHRISYDLVGARNRVVAGQAACLYSLIRPSQRVVRTGRRGDGWSVVLLSGVVCRGGRWCSERCGR